MSPGDYEGTFIKAGDSKKKEGLSIEEATGKPTLRCLSSLENLTKGGLGDRFRGLVWDELLLPIASLMSSLKGPL